MKVSSVSPTVGHHGGEPAFMGCGGLSVSVNVPIGQLIKMGVGTTSLDATGQPSVLVKRGGRQIAACSQGLGQRFIPSVSLVQAVLQADDGVFFQQFS
jgi:hypothetical protein